MTQNEQQLASAHTLLHESAMPQYEQTVADDSKHTGEADDEQFYCVHGEHWFRRKDAQYPKAKTPAMCRVCATKRREQNRTKSELERMEQEKAIDQIPPKGARGGTVRRNLTISQYAATALGVLAVGSSEAATLEMIILDYLRRQDPDVIAFVGRTFEKAQKR
ncbi:hypothetical protein [Alicyclobacillus macrosporangiidus]|uniref:hypothetical protein n=1 Tax=Alicyclobacillus macrosporangiidus TaxID=392015 RepID=UPI0004956025|nr:hypothetical protein [Alicyclobacillus macrosporangiidus]